MRGPLDVAFKFLTKIGYLDMTGEANKGEVLSELE